MYPNWILAARQLKTVLIWELADVREENNIRLDLHLPPKSRKWTFAAASEQISIRNTRICTSSATSHYDLGSWMNTWSESWNSLVDWHLIKLLSSNSTFITHRRVWTSIAWKTPCVLQAQNWPHLWWFLWRIQLKEKHCVKGLVSKDEHMLISHLTAALSLPKFFLYLS